MEGKKQHVTMKLEPHPYLLVTWSLYLLKHDTSRTSLRALLRHRSIGCLHSLMGGGWLNYGPGSLHSEIPMLWEPCVVVHVDTMALGCCS